MEKTFQTKQTELKAHILHSSEGKKKGHKINTDNGRQIRNLPVSGQCLQFIYPKNIKRFSGVFRGFKMVASTKNR